MSSITVTIPDDKVDRVLAAFDYTPEMGSKAAFMKQEIINMIKSKVATAELAKIEYIPPTVDISDLNLS